MWLPTPVYEKIPQFWLLIGLLFVALGLYIGFEFELIFYYLALGVVCVIRSLWIHVLRRRFRGKTQDSIDTPADNDDTGITPVGH